MKYKICFLSGAYRTIDADHYVIDEHLLVFVKDGKPILSAHDEGNLPQNLKSVFSGFFAPRATRQTTREK